MGPISKLRGFSLIELLAALVITAVIASLAMPSYRAAVRKSHRLEATALLMGLHLSQAQWRTAHPAYAGTLEELRASPQAGALHYYRMSLIEVTATRYRLRAEALAARGQAGDSVEGVDCSILEIDQAGTRTPERCWR